FLIALLSLLFPLLPRRRLRPLHGLWGDAVVRQSVKDGFFACLSAPRCIALGRQSVALLKVPEDDLTARRQFIYAGLSLLPVNPEAVRGDHRGTRGDPVFTEAIRSQSLDDEKLLCILLRSQYVALQVREELGIVYRDALETPELRSEVSEI